MPKAITTRFHGPTNTKGSRISASDEDGNRVMISVDHALGVDDRHRAAADALCAKMGWKGPLIGGGLKNGMVFVFVRELDYALNALRTIRKMAYDAELYAAPHVLGKVAKVCEETILELEGK